MTQRDPDSIRRALGPNRQLAWGTQAAHELARVLDVKGASIDLYRVTLQLLHDGLSEIGRAEMRGAAPEQLDALLFHLLTQMERLADRASGPLILP